MDRGNSESQANPCDVEKVRAIFASLLKYIHAKQIYASNNPNLTNFAGALRQSLRAYFETEKDLQFTIEQYRMTWRGEVVYENTQNAESLAFLFYKDGVGEIVIQSSVTNPELEQFVDLITNEIYNPSAHMDIVSRLWQSEFTGISYRVFDEDAGGGAAGAGKGSGASSGEETLRVNDHPHVPRADDGSNGSRDSSDGAIGSLAAYFCDLAGRVCPDATADEKEDHVQNVMEKFFSVSPEKQQAWRDEFAASNERNKLLWLLGIMLDFTQKRHPPPVVRDILDIIERLIHHIAEDGHVPTLFALLEIEKAMEKSAVTTLEFQDLPERIRCEITNSAFLLSLGHRADRPRDDVRELLRYFRCIGESAAAGVCELILNLKDGAMHKEACDTLLAVSPSSVMSLVEHLDLDNPQHAMDAVHLLSRSASGKVPPIMNRLLASPDVQVRARAIQYLTEVRNDEAASILANLLEDEDASKRVMTLAAVESFKHPLIVEKVTAMCFARDTTAKEMDELEHMFRAAGKLAGESVLAQVKQMTKKHGWLALGKNRAKQNKLLAITALRNIPGRESIDALTELSRDGDSLVRTKALYMLKQMDKNDLTRSEGQDPVLSEKTQ